MTNQSVSDANKGAGVVGQGQRGPEHINGYLDLCGTTRETIDAQVAAFLGEHPVKPIDAIALECGPCGVYPDPSDPGSTVCERLHPGEPWRHDCGAVIWSIYWRSKHGGGECFGDAVNRQQIERARDVIGRAWGLA